jgi:hypothetical protein
MTPRRLIRWKSLWLGILVLGFLGWAWRDSFYKVASVSVRAGGVSSADGGLVFAYSPSTAYAWRTSYGPSPFLHPTWGMFQAPAFVRGQGGMSINRDEFYPALKAAPNFSAYCRLVMINQPIGHWIAYLPHWFLMLLFLIPWALCLAWRWRRQRILTKAHDTSPAH